MRILLVFTLATALITGCGSGGSSESLPAGVDAKTLAELGLDEQVVFQPGVRYLTAEQAAAAIVEPHALGFSKRDYPGLAEVSEGDILWSPSATEWEHLFARRVTAVEDIGDTIRFHTREAGLDELFASVSFATAWNDEVDGARADDLGLGTPGSEGDGRPLIEESLDVMVGFAPETLHGLPAHESGVQVDLHSFTSAWAKYGRDPDDPEAEWMEVEVENLDTRTSPARAFRTTEPLGSTAHGYPVHEIADGLNQIRVLVADRFLVRVTGNVAMERLRQAVAGLPLHRLEQLASEAGSTPDNP